MVRLSRRNFLKSAVAAGVLLSAGGVIRAIDQGGFATGRGAAYEPWHTWMEEEAGKDPMLRLVRASILAANAHNTQPWLYRLNEQGINIYADISRNIGTMDPLFREMNISLGCAIENAIISAKAYGYDAKATIIPGQFDSIHIANIALTQGSPEQSELFHAIGSRHTNRAAYDRNKQVDSDVLQQLDRLADDLPDVKAVWFADASLKEKLGHCIIRATEAIVNDPIQAGDSHKWYRHDWDEIQRHKDGTTLDATGNSALTRFFGKLTPVSEQTSNNYWLKMTKEIHVPTAAVFGMILVKDQSDRVQLLQAGRLWQRMHLWSAVHGLAMQPLNQPHERRDREFQLGIEPVFGQAIMELTGEPGFEGVFTFRAGYPVSEGLASPRRSAEEVLLAR
ncbi:hypothetical protein [Paenibacillus sp. NEAU-GSW1]|uniref:hypothetical protein n=1 Tax=Paenibacillus sp. NEAU-GSW1 TaxID=2682486 RepID=UPI0012E12E1F|nr:hypothetical protein [Paenibacillus sp. NEAU-GSW1]MUT64900.1 hypothetical protein [Paenibacillus sp. NEAU-GSW1]